MKLTPLALLLACALLPAVPALAQTPAKPAATKPAPAKPATARPAGSPAPDKTVTIGGAVSATASALPVLTREELRACLNQEESIRTRLAQHEANRAPLDKEREGLGARQEELRAERAQVDAVAARSVAFKSKMEGYSARVAQWNRDVADFNANPPQGQAVERARVRLNAERDALQKSQAELETERQAIVADNEKVVMPFNTRAREVEASVAAWNQRNQAWNEAGLKLEEERKGWVSNCSDRRYREDDEKAIRAGR